MSDAVMPFSAEEKEALVEITQGIIERNFEELPGPDSLGPVAFAHYSRLSQTAIKAVEFMFRTLDMIDEVEASFDEDQFVKSLDSKEAGDYLEAEHKRREANKRLAKEIRSQDPDTRLHTFAEAIVDRYLNSKED